jgi:hypothetical protein
MRLDLDAPGVEADERVGDHACEHTVDGTGESVTEQSRLCAKSVPTQATGWRMPVGAGTVDRVGA